MPPEAACRSTPASCPKTLDLPLHDGARLLLLPLLLLLFMLLLILLLLLLLVLLLLLLLLLLVLDHRLFHIVYDDVAALLRIVEGASELLCMVPRVEEEPEAHLGVSTTSMIFCDPPQCHVMLGLLPQSAIL